MRMENYSTVMIGKMLCVASFTVARWIDDGELKAFITPGGHRRVYAEDLLVFLKKHRMKLPSELQAMDNRVILVVDDDPSVIRAVTKILKTERKDHKILSAKDGFEAGQMVAQHNPLLMILDLKFPGLDAFAVCRKIKEKSKVTKVLAITGLDIEKNIKKIKASGADGWIAKPFTVEELNGKVREMLKD